MAGRTSSGTRRAFDGGDGVPERDAKQAPGPDNALGKVKFLFPNKYSTYLHDTPHQSGFDPTKRTFSHGCIRLEHAVDLAEQLLQGQGDWDRGKMDEVMATNVTTN